MIKFYTFVLYQISICYTLILLIMETKEMNLDEMEALTGGSWQACVCFGLSALSMATGPEGILGLGGMAMSAGDCEG